jgi:hypothetical protein
MPLEGFTEKREPDGWDLGLGKVIGYRSWNFRRHNNTCRIMNNAMDAYDRFDAYSYSSEELLKRLGYHSSWYSGGACRCSHGLFGKWGQQWPTKVMEAKCSRDESVGWPFIGGWPSRVSAVINCPRVLDKPDECGCGIWAYWDLPADADFAMDRSGSAVYWPVAGRIEGSSRVVIGEKGFRCEKATLTHLFVVHNTPKDVTDDLEKTFGIPVFRGGKNTPFTNPVHDSIKQNTEADPVYGPTWHPNDPMWRKTIRVITGF